MSEPFDYFKNSPLKGFESLQTGTSFELAHIDGAFLKTGYDESPFDQDKLVRNLLGYWNDDRQPMPFFSCDYIGRLTATRIVNGMTVLENVVGSIRTNHSNKTEYLDSFTLSLNTKLHARLDSGPSYSIKPDINEERATYDIYFTYVEGTYSSSGDIFVDLTSRDSNFEIIDQKSRIVGAHFQTNNYYHFYMLLYKFGIKPDQMLNRVFSEVYVEIPITPPDFSGDSLRLCNNFYSQAPPRVIKKLQYEELALDFYRLFAYDLTELFIDNSAPIIKCLTAILEKDKGAEHLYNELKNQPKLIKLIYESMNGSASFDGITMLPPIFRTVS